MRRVCQGVKRQACLRKNRTMKVMLISEDEKLVEEIYRSFRESWPRTSPEKAEVLNCGCGEEGISRVRSKSPDMLLIDRTLPGINGLETLSRVRRFSDAPAIILYPDGSDTNRLVEALEHGADGYMVKPVRRMEMLARVQALTRRRQAVGSGLAQFRVLRSSLAY
jgi:DNA-binding response OmpR family regulator